VICHITGAGADWLFPFRSRVPAITGPAWLVVRWHSRNKK
jgi:hypothetical protein